MSKRFSLNKEDLLKWGKNALIFLAPVLIVFFTAIRDGASIENALYLVYLWAINVVIDLLRKFVQK
jgi:hypothetical protein